MFRARDGCCYVDLNMVGMALWAPSGRGCALMCSTIDLNSSLRGSLTARFVCLMMPMRLPSSSSAVAVALTGPQGRGLRSKPHSAGPPNRSPPAANDGQ